MIRHFLRILLLLSFVAGATVRGNEGSWRPASPAIQSPHGDPLTEQLVFSSAERSLFTDALDGRLDESARDGILDAALVACGDDDPTALNRYRHQFAAVSDELRSYAAQNSEPASKIELVHRLLHARLLHGGYDANATDLAGTFNTGIYNCASATLLFVALAEQIHLNVHAVELPGHVRAIVECNDRRCEVEATCAVWSGAARWEPTPTSSGRELTPLGLIALIYYNRGVDSFYHHRFAESVALNRKSLLLDPNNETARGNLLAAINNWALALAEVHRFDEAEKLLAAGSRFAPEHLPFQHNAAHVRLMQTQSTNSAGAVHPTPPISAASNL